MHDSNGPEGVNLWARIANLIQDVKELIYELEYLGVSSCMILMGLKELIYELE
jgi:hypothetical protein